MTLKELAQYRLYNQQITQDQFKTVGELVAWMGAMQAQDYAAGKWAIGARMNGITDADVEKAIEHKEIIRSWPMRGTLHFVSPDDIRWMQALTTPYMLRGVAKRWQNLGLDENTVERAKEVFAKALKGGKVLTRKEMLEVLEKAGISTASQRGYHILWYASQTALLCFGPVKDKEQTFVLLDEWVPEKRTLTREESLGEFTKRYFTSHGPATLQDFMWWTGLPARDLTIGIDITKSALHTEAIEGKTYYMGKQMPDVKDISKTAFLLPPFEEYLLGYKDRSAVLDKEHAQKIVPGLNGMFKPIIVIGGGVEGIWQRTIKKDSVSITLHPFEKFTPTQHKALAAAATRYSKFLGVQLSYNVVL